MNTVRLLHQAEHTSRRAYQIFHEAEVFATNMTSGSRDFKLMSQDVSAIKGFLEYLAELDEQKSLDMTEKCVHAEKSYTQNMIRNGYKYLVENGAKVEIKFIGDKVKGICPDITCEHRENALSLQNGSIITSNMTRHLLLYHEKKLPPQQENDVLSVHATGATAAANHELLSPQTSPDESQKPQKLKKPKKVYV
jgi:hypothetical protein